MKHKLIKILFFLCALCCTVCLFAQEEENADSEEKISEKKSEIKIENIFIGIGPEVNNYTREGVSLGATLLMGVDLDKPMSAGIRASYFNDLDTVAVLEFQAFYRYFLPWPDKKLFAQADAGIMIAVEDGGNYPAFAGGISAGYRIINNEKMFLDAGARFGYPYMWAVNCIFGFKTSASDLFGSGRPRGEGNE